MSNSLLLKEFIEELESLERKKASQETLQRIDFFKERLVILSTKQGINKYIFINIANVNRFTIEIKSEKIYESKNYVVNKKKFICLVSEWRDWDWTGYYPFKRSLYDWQKEKEKATTNPGRARKKKTTKRNTFEENSLEGWPFTSGISDPTRDRSLDSKKMGGNRDT